MKCQEERANKFDNRFSGAGRTSNPSDLKDYETNKSAKPANGVMMQRENTTVPLEPTPTDVRERQRFSVIS